MSSLSSAWSNCATNSPEGRSQNWNTGATSPTRAMSSARPSSASSSSVAGWVVAARGSACGPVVVVEQRHGHVAPAQKPGAQQPDRAAARDQHRLTPITRRSDAPALDQTAVDVEQVEAAADRLVDDVVDGLRLVIEGRHRRHDDGAVLGRRQHGLEMAGMQRRLAHHEHQPPPLLQHHVGGAAHQAVGGAIGDVGKRADRAWRDHHAARLERAARHRGGDVAIGIGLRRQRAHRRRPKAPSPPSASPPPISIR